MAMYDNGTMRDATTEEQTNINTKLGGGSSRFELIYTGSISTPTYRLPIAVDDYDEIYVEITEIQGEGNLVLQPTIASTTTTTTTRLLNFLTNTDKTVKCLWQRITENNYLVSHMASGGISGTNITEISNNDNYKNKISKLTVTTGTSEKQITKAQIKLYGRNMK